jgi:Glycosyl hydrolase family 115
MSISRRQTSHILGLAGLGLGASCLWGTEAEAQSRNAFKSIKVAPTLPQWMDVVVGDLVGDLDAVGLGRPNVTRSSQFGIGITITDIQSAPGDLQGLVTMAASEEEFVIRSLNPSHIAIVGRTATGVRRGIYHFARHVLKIDPMWRWTGLGRAQLARLPAQVHLREGKPPFRHRGWFINDEDLLTEWRPASGARRIDYPYYANVMNLGLLDEVCETAARCGMNMMIPSSLVNILNPDEARLIYVAARRGLRISHHHVEPVGVSGFTFAGYWKARGQAPRFSLYSEREKLLEVWRASIAAWAPYNPVWALGLRGTGDRPLWIADPSIPQDAAIVGRLISEALEIQRAMILEHSATPDLTTVLWAEGARLLADGYLTIPKDVTVVFSDNGPGVRFQKDFEAPREFGRKYGVYYHHQLWDSGPHLAQGVAPTLSQRALARANATGANDYALFNASNIREFVMGLSLSSDQVSLAKPADVKLALITLCQKWFGDRNARQVANLYDAYFVAFERELATDNCGAWGVKFWAAWLQMRAWHWRVVGGVPVWGP